MVRQHPLQTGACRRCGLAVSQPCRGHEEPVEATDLSATGRRTPTDQVRTRRSTGRARSVPGVQRQEAINPNSADVQRMKRSTPIAGRVSSGRRTNVKLQPPDLDRTEHSNPPVRSGCLKDQRQLRFSSSTLETGGERIILRSYPCNRDHAPRVSMVGNLGKSLTVQSLSRPGDRQKRACGTPLQDCRQIVHKTSLATLRTPGLATATTVRRSGAAEAPAFSALSACRRAPSAAS